MTRESSRLELDPSHERPKRACNKADLGIRYSRPVAR